MSAATALLAGGAALQSFGAIKAGQDQSAALKYNADVATQEGQAATLQAAAEEAQKRREVSAIQARQRLLIGSSGLSGGTMEDVQADTAQQGEMDALRIRYGGELAKRRAGAQAVLDKAAAKSSASAGLLAGLGAGLSGGYQTYAAQQGYLTPRRGY